MLRTVVALAFVACLLSPAYGGAVGGPVTDGTQYIDKDHTKSIGNFVTFRGGELAVIASAGRSYRTVRIKVYDAAGTLVAQDLSERNDPEISLALVTFVPGKTAEYKITIECSGAARWRTN